MLDWRNNLVYIPEIGFGDFASVMVTTSYNADYISNKDIYKNGRVTAKFTITNTDIDKLQGFTQEIINLGSRVKEIIIFIDNNENVISYNNCLINNIESRIAEDFLSKTMSTDIINYVLEISVVAEYSQQVTFKMYNRKKKLRKLVSKITSE